MKKLLSVLFVLALVIIACSRKTVATKEAGTNGTTEISQGETSKSTAEPADATLMTAGKAIYETKCTRCHGMKPTALYTAERWDGILKLMAPNARLTEIETQQVTAYVRANAKN